MVSIPSSNTPALVQTLQWVFNPLGYMRKNFEQRGDFFRAEVSPVNPEPIVFINHPEAIQYLLTHDSSEELTSPGEVNVQIKALFGENSVLLLNGKQHRQRRQLIVPPFHGERMRAYGDLICTIAREVMGTWEIGKPLCIRDTMQQITMRVILQAVFGLHEGDRYRRLERLLAERLNLITTPLTSIFIFFPQLMPNLGSWSLAGQVKRLIQETDDLLYAEIRERRAVPNPNATDVLSMLLSARDEDGQGLTDAQLHDELITLLIAGHETTATALAWAFYWIHRLPEVRQKLMAELSAHQYSTDWTAIARLPYLTAVCNETLRIYPVAMVTLPRRVEKPIQIKGYDLEPGMLLMGCIYLVHHREDLYPDSNTFQPERFIERNYSPYQFLPFGGGVRRCVGAALAMYEMTLILSTILNECDLKLLETQEVKPVRRGGTLAPGGGVSMCKVGDRPPRFSDHTTPQATSAAYPVV
ncbi:MAG: cytochrome P450 [Rhizonema sp. PD37]|nr:cytochrome P450 [Rhizonema sp. PD37]